METLTIHVTDADSAREMLAALSGFQAELVMLPGGHVIVVTLDGGDGETAGVLDALQRYMTKRAGGAARLDFDGQSYVMHAEPELPDGL